MAGGGRERRKLSWGCAVLVASALSACAAGSTREVAPAGFAPPEPAGEVPQLDAPSPPVAATVPPSSTTPPGKPRLTSTSTSTATAPTTTAAPSTTLDPDVGNVSMAFAGDALWHSPLWRGAQQSFAGGHGGAAGYDFGPMLAGLAPVVAAADLAVCHLETPIAPEGEDFTTFPNYGVPAEVAPAIAAAGFDRCSTASNHTLDRGLAGIDRTVHVLLSAGLGQSGMARTPEEIEPIVFVVDGVAIAHLSYTFGYNGKHMPAGQEWRSALIDPDRIVADARAAEVMGAELVIVSMHWGNEGSSAITGEQRQLAEQLTASGAIDLIVGHHAHVLQPIEQINGIWVIYGLGNMISNMPTGGLPQPGTQDGAIAAITFTRRADGTLEVTTPVIHPTWVDRNNGWIVRLVQPALADPATPDGLRGQLQASLARTRAVLGAYVAPT